MTDPATIGQAAAGFGILFGGLYGGWKAHRSDKHAQAAAAQAEQAAQNAYPISNGLGTELRERARDTHRLVMQMHEAQLLADRRALDDRAALEDVRDLLQTHLMDHARESTT